MQLCENYMIIISNRMRICIPRDRHLNKFIVSIVRYDKIKIQATSILLTRQHERENIIDVVDIS